VPTVEPTSPTRPSPGEQRKLDPTSGAYPHEGDSPVTVPPPSAPALSIVIPALNEAAGIETCLATLAPLRPAGVELILVDGGSEDDTLARATPLVDLALCSPPGRARQMNLGARAARASRLMFVHADTRLPDAAAARVIEALEASCWGRFDVTIEGRHRWLPMIAAAMNLRSRLTGIATGDQAMFLRRSTFERIGGFPDQPLMEDIEMSRRLKRQGRPACLSQRVITDGRRWDTEGALRTLFKMWGMRLGYAVGASPHRLAKAYRQVR